MTRKEIQELAKEMKGSHIDPEHHGWPGILKHGRIEPVPTVAELVYQIANEMLSNLRRNVTAQKLKSSPPWNRRDTI